MRETPMTLESLDDLGIQVIGAVHSLRGVIPDILKEIKRFSPDYICVELSEPKQMSNSFEVDAVRQLYFDKMVCIDRFIGVTASRYLSGTPQAAFLKETIWRFCTLPFNTISIIAYNELSGIYKRLFGDMFYTFGWSKYDKKAYIYERDEYMAGRLAELLRSGQLIGKCMVIVGRRHVPGIKAILEAYRSTHDIGSYYAGGRVYDVFSFSGLDEPYTLSYEQSNRNYLRNRIIETMVRAIFLPTYVLLLFLLLVTFFIAVTIGFIILTKVSL